MKWVIIAIILILLGSTVTAGNILGKDKIAHFSSSMFLTCWTNGFGDDVLGMNKADSRYLGVGITLSLGLGKEGNDLWLKETEWCWYDLMWDVMGIGCGLIVINNGLI